MPPKWPATSTRPAFGLVWWTWWITKLNGRTKSKWAPWKQRSIASWLSIWPVGAMAIGVWHCYYRRVVRVMISTRTPGPAKHSKHSSSSLHQAPVRSATRKTLQTANGSFIFPFSIYISYSVAVSLIEGRRNLLLFQASWKISTFCTERSSRCWSRWHQLQIVDDATRRAAMALNENEQT